MARVGPASPAIDALAERSSQSSTACAAAEVLRESHMLIDELLEADVIVAGVPMYNFGPPAPFKAGIDNLVRVGKTFGFDRSRAGEPYWPLLAAERWCCACMRGSTTAAEARCSYVRAEPHCVFAFVYLHCCM